MQYDDNHRSSYTVKASCNIYRAMGGHPAENLRQVIDMAGGIQHFIGCGDVVIVKPNGQWWNQGATNLAALKTLIDLIMGRPVRLKIILGWLT